MEKKKLVGIMVLILFFMLSLVFAQTEPIREETSYTNFTEEDGSSIERAIIIKYVGDYAKSIHQEYEYLDMKFGKRGKDWKLKLQESITENEKAYDKMTIEMLPSGEEKILYFDITEPFGELTKQLQ